MNTKSLLIAGVLTFANIVFPTSGLSADEAPAVLPPITEISGIRPSGTTFGAWDKPTQISSAAEAEKHFEGDALAKLKESVDFEKQTVLIFAWRGSGQDKLDHIVAESFPEQITFSIRRGRTRDLRPHVHLYALRNNVKWSTAAGRR